MSAVTFDLQFELVDTDALVEAVLCAPDPRTRVAIVAAIVQDLSAAVEWVHAEAPVADSCAAVELDGVHQLRLFGRPTSSPPHEHCGCPGTGNPMS